VPRNTQAPPAPLADAPPESPASAPVAAAEPERPAVAPIQAETPESPQEPTLPWWIPGGIAILAALLALGFFAMRGRRNRDSGPAVETGESPAASAPARLAPLPAKGPPVPTPRPQFGTSALSVDFTPVSLQQSIRYVTLAYRLTLAVNGPPARDVVIDGDFISAHASRDTAELLAPSRDRLVRLHEAALVAPGESLELSGTLRLSIEEIDLVRQGRATLFVPLARFIVSHGERSESHVFTFGEPPRREGGALVPFRLDHGPRHALQLVARPIDAERWLAMDPVRRAS
jgi:hypothetical protein